jgi:hypothetical protein
MTSFIISSHNLQSKFHLFQEETNEFLRANDLNIACFQDIGAGPNLSAWNGVGSAGHVIVNRALDNKSRTVATLVGKGWQVSGIKKSQNGGAVAVTVHHQSIEATIVNAYPSRS